jgi:hypothetical protein
MMARNLTPEQLLTRGLGGIQKQIAAIEKIQRATKPCLACKCGGGLLSIDLSRQLVQLVETARKAAADQYDPRRTLARMTEAELERIANEGKPKKPRTEPVPVEPTDE